MDRETALKLYKTIYLIRACEEKVCTEYARDEMKTPVHMDVGAEAIAAGVLSALPPPPQVFATYRNHAVYLALTGNIHSFFAELYGKATGCAGGKAGSMHLSAPEQGLILTSAVVASTIPVAVGAALANHYQGRKGVVVAFFGDGAMEEGVFWESLNFACLRRLKILFVCEDNDLAICARRFERQAFRSIKKAVSGFNCHFGHAKGYQPLLVFEATKRVLGKMGSDPKPGFLHLEYFRFLDHVGVHQDFDAGLRKKPSTKDLEKMNPLLNGRAMALNCGISSRQISMVQKAIDREIGRGVQRAKADPFPASNMLYEGI